MKSKTLVLVSATLIIVTFFACSKNDTSTPTTSTATLAYTNFDELVASLLKRGFVQKDSLSTSERLIFVGLPRIPQSVITSNNATRLFFVKGTTDCYELAKKSSGIWNMPDSIRNDIGVALFKNGSSEIPVVPLDGNLSGTKQLIICRGIKDNTQGIHPPYSSSFYQ